MRYTLKRQDIENAMIRTGSEAIKTVQLEPGDMIRIQDKGRTVTDGIAVVADVSLMDIPDQPEGGHQLYVVRISKPGRENEYQVGDDWTVQTEAETGTGEDDPELLGEC